MRGHGAKLDHKREQAVIALMTCPSLAEAAKQCGIAEITLHRWQSEPTFQAAYASARRKSMEQAVSALQKATSAATEALVSIVADTDAPPSVRVSAARAILEYSFKGTELLDMEARLAALEAALSAQEKEQA